MFLRAIGATEVLAANALAARQGLRRVAIAVGVAATESKVEYGAALAAVFATALELPITTAATSMMANGKRLSHDEARGVWTTSGDVESPEAATERWMAEKTRSHPAVRLRGSMTSQPL
eukprot:4258230-Prymnesium_polylepis.1